MFKDHSITRRRCCKYWEAMLGNCWIHVLSRDLCENNCRVCVVASKDTIVVFPSYSALLTLEYGDRMEKSQVTRHQAEEEGLSFREAERVIESKLFLDEYPLVGPWDPPLVGYPAWDVPSCCRMGAERGGTYVLHWGCQSSILEPNPEAGQSAMELVG